MLKARARGEVRRVAGETWRENPVVVFRVSKQDFFLHFFVCVDQVCIIL